MLLELTDANSLDELNNSLQADVINIIINPSKILKKQVEAIDPSSIFLLPLTSRYLMNPSKYSRQYLSPLKYKHKKLKKLKVLQVLICL
jgi:hypothetical protein